MNTGHPEKLWELPPTMRSHRRRRDGRTGRERMMRWRRWVLIVMASVMMSLVAHDDPADGCAPAMREGDSVGISTESALIVWDPATSTEHFIRSAQFVTDAEDFGFLVPTPTPPELGEVGGSLFAQLRSQTAARVIRTSEKQSIFRLFRADAEDTAVGSAGPPSGPMENSVQVLSREQVAGYDAAVLKAADPNALSDWLNDHGYMTRPALTEWLKHYVDNQWVITAFKLSRNEGGRGIVASPVRLSFQTEKPFYPYREPADMRDGAVKARPRTLRVFFLSDKRYSASIGDAGTNPTRVRWAGPLDEPALQNLERSMRLSESLNAPIKHLTEFEDGSSPRPGTDELYFQVASTQDQVERPPIRRHRVVKEYWPNLPQWTAWFGLLPLALPAIWMLRKRPAA